MVQGLLCYGASGLHYFHLQAWGGVWTESHLSCEVIHNDRAMPSVGGVL